MNEIIEPEITEAEGPPWWKRWVVLAMGVFLLGISLSYFMLGPAYDTIIGQIESSPLEHQVISVGNFSLMFTTYPLAAVQELFLGSAGLEFSVCLLGEKMANGDYLITDYYQPKVYSNSFRHVTSDSCSSETVVMLHSHPYKSCVGSETDLATLAAAQRANPELVMVVMCEPGRFSVYS